MPELRKDPIIGRWVIIATERSSRPSDFESQEVSSLKTCPGKKAENGSCPFCEGNELMTPPEVDSDRAPGTSADSSGWQTRTVPNKYPILKNEPNIEEVQRGVFDVMSGVGEHEVIIEGTKHDQQLADLSVEQIQRIIEAYKRRSLHLSKDKRFKYVLIFKNYGVSAGASLEHTHTQLISLPIIPKRVAEEFVCSSDYFKVKNSCLFCDIIKQEIEEAKRDICENEDFIAFCPFASRSPFEITIMPKSHQTHFTDITDKQIGNFAQIFKDVLMRVKIVLNDPPYNFIIHTSSINDEKRDYYHWHLEFMPKLSKIAGFEWGTGFYINSTAPEVAAKFLKGV